MVGSGHVLGKTVMCRTRSGVDIVLPAISLQLRMTVHAIEIAAFERLGPRLVRKICVRGSRS